MQKKLNILQNNPSCFFCKDKMFFVSYCVVIWQEHHKDFSYLFWQNPKGFGQTSLLKKLWWGFVHLWVCFFFNSFSEFLLGLRACIWSCQFYLSQSWERWGLCCSLGIAAGFCAGLAEQKSVAQAWCLSVPQGDPSPYPCADKYSVFSFDPLMKSACFISDLWVMFLSLFSLSLP